MVFAHGSGSGRQSPRYRYVASILNNESKIATLFVDLLTAEDKAVNSKQQVVHSIVLDPLQKGSFTVSQSATVNLPIAIGGFAKGPHEPDRAVHPTYKS